jgi:hypothetical protein
MPRNAHAFEFCFNPLMRRMARIQIQGFGIRKLGV